MIIYSESLYCDEKIKGNKQKALKKGIKGDYWFIMLPEHGNNLLEIVEAQYLRQPYYKKKNIYVVGLTETKESAEQLVCRIVEDCCTEDGSIDIRHRLFEV